MAHEEGRGPRARLRRHPRPLRRGGSTLRRARRETRRAPLHPRDGRRRRGVLLQLQGHAQVPRGPRHAIRQGGRHRIPPEARRRRRRRVRAARSRDQSRRRLGHNRRGHLPTQRRRERPGVRIGRRHRQVRVGRGLTRGDVPRRRPQLRHGPVARSQTRMRERSRPHPTTVQRTGRTRVVFEPGRSPGRVRPRRQIPG